MNYIKDKKVIGFFITIVMLIIGVAIGGKIHEFISDKNAVYNKALKIEDKDIFQYGMKTNVGNAFVHGEIKAIDTVTFSEIGEEYSYIEKVKERYTMHTRTVTTTVNGKARTRTKVYWTWDRVGSEERKSKEVEFLDKTFEYSQFIMPSSDYLKTIKESSHVRYKYYVVPTTIKGTIYANLKNNNIGNNVIIYENMKANEACEYAKDTYYLVWVFWIFWIILVVGIWYVLFNYDW